MSKAVAELQRTLGKGATEEEVEALVRQYSSSRSIDLSDEEFERMERTLLLPLKEINVALVVVDFQNDFIDGSLGIKKGPANEDPLDAVPLINKLASNPLFKMVVYTQDWHPQNHISFYEHARNEDRELSPDDKTRKLRPFDIVRFERPDTIQVLYPSHCVQGSWGAQLHPELKIVEGAKIVKKGSAVFVDSYSAFADNHGVKKSELEALFRSSGINTILACGVAYDICVMHTLKDAANLGFLSAIVADASKGLSEAKMSDADELFHKKQVAIMTAEQAADVVQKRFVPLEWARILSNRANK